jgi:hypothetical protein
MKNGRRRKRRANSTLATQKQLQQPMPPARRSLPLPMNFAAHLCLSEEDIDKIVAKTNGQEN